MLMFIYKVIYFENRQKQNKLTDVVERFEGMGDIMGKIVGGAETEANKWNFIVRLDGVAAGGTILSDHYVLTAAHICQGLAKVLRRF